MKVNNSNTFGDEYLYFGKNAVEVIDNIIKYAIDFRASDIHIDPREEYLEVMIRVDGALVKTGYIEKGIHEEIIARLKVLSGARTDIHAVPQDGQWKMKIEKDNYNLRISFMPTFHGENAVIRILPMNMREDITFSKLGFNSEQRNIIERALARTSGIVLVTGPTGSGKTTTLHTCLLHKVLEPISIITLEDPVEYEIKGVRQIHVKHNCGVTFASALRAVLRQDPDIIMVGEIRDNETAKIAIHTALTGHLVFSTLHTNSALESIPRLVDMGVDHFLLAATLRLIIAQRLVRKICENCLGIGCPICKETGYWGRSVIAEICEVDTQLSNLIEKKESQKAILACARENGFHSLSEHAWEKVEWGITSKEEILRVLSN